MKKISLKFRFSPGPDAGREVFQMCVEHHWTLTEMIPFETRLEDIFRKLTKKTTLIMTYHLDTE